MTPRFKDALCIRHSVTWCQDTLRHPSAKILLNVRCQEHVGDNGILPEIGILKPAGQGEEEEEQTYESSLSSLNWRWTCARILKVPTYNSYGGLVEWRTVL
eukprot:scaffold24294_cov186-Cylindrotheca_fusiformis.AAC.1